MDIQSQITSANLPLLQVDKLNFFRGEKQILSEVSLELFAGEVVSLIGPNGSGKSTLLALIAGDITPQTGSVQLLGKEIKSYKGDELARIRALIEQSPSLAFNFCVEEVVQMGRSPWRGLPESADDDQIVQRVMAETEILDFTSRQNSSLSGGEAARMHIARVLAQQAQLLLLDEPGAALDVRHQEQIMRLARQNADLGRGVLVISHDLDTAAAWSNKVMLLEAGRVRAYGAPQEVLNDQLLSQVYQTPIEVLKHPYTGDIMVRPKRGI